MMNGYSYDEGIWLVDDFRLDGVVDITDPCYDNDTWCRITEHCEAGNYYAHIKVKDEGEWGKRIEYIAIYKDNDDSCAYNGQMHTIGTIGVDAGLAGFFRDKPDYNDEQWSEFVSEMGDSKNNVWSLPYGVFSSSGYGDGGYWVYANKERTAFAIRFIDDGNENVFYAN